MKPSDSMFNKCGARFEGSLHRQNEIRVCLCAAHFLSKLHILFLLFFFTLTRCISFIAIHFFFFQSSIGVSPLGFKQLTKRFPYHFPSRLFFVPLSIWVLPPKSCTSQKYYVFFLSHFFSLFNNDFNRTLLSKRSVRCYNFHFQLLAMGIQYNL